MLDAKVKSITELDLSENRLVLPEAMTAVAHLIAGSLLQVLRLNRNAMGDVGVQELANALDQEACPGCAQQHLELQSCRIGTAGASHLFMCLANNQSLRYLNLSDNFIDDKMDTALIEDLTYLHDLHLTGNRLSYSGVQAAEHMCLRNQQRTRDETPMILRAKMHQLLFQETKRSRYLAQVAEDEKVLAERYAAKEATLQELDQFLNLEAEIQRRLKCQIAQEDHALQSQYQAVARLNIELEETRERYMLAQQQLREKLASRERRLVDLQVESAELDAHFARRREEHPKEVERVKLRIETANREAECLNRLARETRATLQSLQEKTLINFKL